MRPASAHGRRTKFAALVGFLSVGAITIAIGRPGGTPTLAPSEPADATQALPDLATPTEGHQPDTGRMPSAAAPTLSRDRPVSGEPLPTGERPGWRLLIADDFAMDVGAGRFPGPLTSSWDVYPRTWRDTSGNGTYSPEIVTIHDGLMDIHLRTEQGVTKVAALVPLLPQVAGWDGQTYGRYAVRFRADPVPGFKTAWLLWPRSEVWPRDGEIDFPEGDLTGTIGAYLHHQGATTGRDQTVFSTSARYTTWHTAIIEWTPGRCEFFLDGVSIGASTTRVPNTAMRWVIQTETALSGGPPAAAAAGHVLIDWIAIWAYQP